MATKEQQTDDKISISLNKNQLLAVQMLASGGSGKAVAEKLGVTPETISRWRQEPQFKEELSNLLYKTRENVQQRLACMMTKALDAVEESFDDPTLKAKEKCMMGLKVLDLCRVKEIDIKIGQDPDIARVMELQNELYKKYEREY
jgi:transcriptional regulator with XRE-family HTH domain